MFMIKRYIKFLTNKIIATLIESIILIGINLRIYHLSIVGFLFLIDINSDKKNLSFLSRIIRKRKKKFIFLLQKEGFNQDTSLIKEHITDIETIPLSRKLIKKIARCFLSKDLEDNSYCNCSEIHLKSKSKLFEFYNFIFSNIPANYKPISILTGNIGYYAEQELFKAAFRNHIKGIAIHKECIKTNGERNLFNYVYSVRREVFGGSLVLVYNKMEMDLQKKSLIIDSTKTKIKVIGAPRIDQAHKLRKNNQVVEKHKVLLLGFPKKRCLPFIARKSYLKKHHNYEFLKRTDKLLEWKNLQKDLCDVYFNCAKQNPKIEFLIKLKPAFNDQKDFLDYFNLNHKLKNLKVITQGDYYSILKDSTVVIGFNSTAIFEALARGTEVIVPQFGECKQKKYKPYFIDFKKSSAKIASTKESFQKIMHNILIKKPKFKNEISKEDKLLLDKWVGNSDGKSNERLISALKKELY